jgi:hypothetical protein
MIVLMTCQIQVSGYLKILKFDSLIGESTIVHVPKTQIVKLS